MSLTVVHLLLLIYSRTPAAGLPVMWVRFELSLTFSSSKDIQSDGPQGHVYPQTRLALCLLVAAAVVPHGMSYRTTVKVEFVEIITVWTLIWGYFPIVFNCILLFTYLNLRTESHIFEVPTYCLFFYLNIFQFNIHTYFWN